MADYTITATCKLPSGGKIYGAAVDPEVTLRSMTTADEMKRLSYSDRPNKPISDVLDDCILSDLGISAYDLAVPDQQYLVHQLRIATYGPDYKLQTVCPYCRSENIDTIDLSQLPLHTFDESLLEKYGEIELPQSKKKIKLRFQTPRSVDSSVLDAKEIKRKNPEALDNTIPVTVASSIGTIDGIKYEQYKVIDFVRKLPMRDTNYIIKAADKLNNGFGLETRLEHKCDYCGLNYHSNFRTTAEFFGPSID